MKKVLILQRIISSYNMPLYKQINKKYDVLLAYGQQAEEECAEIEMVKVHYPDYQAFKEMPEEAFGRFMDGLLSACEGRDIAVLPMEPHSRILSMIERLHKNKVKAVLWGIGVAAGYNTRYDSQDYRSPSFESMVAMADASVFYTAYPVKKYSSRCIPKEKMFVAHNTVAVDPVQEAPCKRDLFLFVGTLLKQKRVDVLLRAYAQCLEEMPDAPDLVVIGKGEEYGPCKEWVEQNGLDGKITLAGPIYEEAVLKGYFSRALAVVSPDQAGLSVLKAMGYGVPFITCSNAITGGEIFNIEHGVNGVLFDDFSELKGILCDIAGHPEKYRQMGERAYAHYHSCRTVADCAKGFFDAFAYVLDEGENR